MKVKDMIAKLQEQDPEGELEFPLHTYTQVYPSVYVRSSDFDVHPGPDHNPVVRIYIHLPEGFTISERKKK